MTERRAALITGSNGGIGKALCNAFHAAGYLVVATDLDDGPPSAADLFLRQDLCELVGDAAARTTFRDRLNEFTRTLHAKLHVLVNNAAIQITGSMDDATVDDFESSLRVNVAAPFALAKLFAAELRAARGSIINVGSIHGRLTKPGFCCYSTTKAALAGLTRALALDFAGEVTVNTVAPAATDTAMLRAGFHETPEKLAELAEYHPAGRIGDAAEVAQTAVYLASDQARFMTGAELAVDGGIGIRLHDPA